MPTPVTIDACGRFNLSILTCPNPTPEGRIVRIRTLIGGIAVAATATITIGAPALATVGDETPPAGSCVETSGAIKADVTVKGVVYHCDASSNTWTSNVTTNTTDNSKGNGNTNGNQTQKADATAKGDGAVAQQCNQQAGTVVGSQVCVIVNGTFTLVAKPAECTGATCNAPVAEVPATTPCEAGKTLTATINGAKAECTCAKKANGQTVLQVKKVAVTSSAGQAGALAVTGSNATTIALVGGGIVLAGVAGVVVARRRRVRFQA